MPFKTGFWEGGIIIIPSPATVLFADGPPRESQMPKISYG